MQSERYDPTKKLIKNNYLISHCLSCEIIAFENYCTEKPTAATNRLQLSVAENESMVYVHNQCKCAHIQITKSNLLALSLCRFAIACSGLFI